MPESSRANLLPEVTNLVESPTAVLGAFDAAFLRLPRSANVTPSPAFVILLLQMGMSGTSAVWPFMLTRQFWTRLPKLE